MAEVWPSILVPQSVMFRIRAMNAKGPASSTGRRQAVATDAGYWVASINDIIVRNRDHILEYRGLIAALDGSANDLIIGPFDCGLAPFMSGASQIGGIPFSDDSFFSDGAGFSQSAILVNLAGDMQMGATSATLAIEAAGTIRRGMYFSISNRLYIITSVPEMSGSTVSFSFMPPLRQDAFNGGSVEFARPKATMRLMDSESGEMTINVRRFARPSLQLEESY